jgi:glycosyltransferase involved in cell wall biosynthesis
VADRDSAPEVAVVVPCHRQADLLPDAVASVAAQTWPRIHCVIVDDGSPDATAQVARDLIARFHDRRIELVAQDNRGLGAARNAGIRASAAPFVLPLDADDRLLPHAVERMVAVLRADPSLSVVTPLGRTFGACDLPLVTLPASRGRLRRGNCLIYASMFTRAAFDLAGGYHESLRPQGYEDWDLWLRMLGRGARFAHLPEDLVRYRKHAGSMLREADAQATLLRARIVLEHPELYPAWRRALAARLVARPERPSLLVRLGLLLALLLDGRRRLLLRELRG